MELNLTPNNFEKAVCYWAGILNLDFPTLYKNNEMKWTGYIKIQKRGYIFCYNYSRLEEITTNEVMEMLYHELGHVKAKTYLLEDKVEGEYLAQKFALKYLKKYYPKLYKKSIKSGKQMLKNKNWCQNFPIHAQAYEKIKEYK